MVNSAFCWGGTLHQGERLARFYAMLAKRFAHGISTAAGPCGGAKAQNEISGGEGIGVQPALGLDRGQAMAGGGWWWGMACLKLGECKAR